MRGADDSLVVKPVIPWQGMIYDAWELRLLSNMVNDKSEISFALTDLMEGLSSAIPELQGAPLAQMLIDDIRAQARGNESPKRSWALFIVELGRQAKGHERYDLLSDVDPATVQLDGIQTSLILRRLATDLLIAAGPKQTNMNLEPVEWPHFQIFAQPAYAASNLPCTLDSEQRTIMDLTAYATKFVLRGTMIGKVGFEGFYNYLERNGVAGAGAFKRLTGYASLLTNYAQLIYTYLALTVDISIDKQPLVRTKNLSPASGERGRLSASVRMDVGKAQMFNCFRIMLNSVGLDFSVRNDGPLKGAHVAWVGLEGFDETVAVLHGGPEQIVRFVGDPANRIQNGGDPSSGINVVTNQIVGADGMVYVNVEGVGQRKALSDKAQKLIKQAGLDIQVAVKGADFFKDLKDVARAGVSGVKALITFPADLLYRTKWASAGHYSFEVQDWDEVEDFGMWSGKITGDLEYSSTSSTQDTTTLITRRALVTISVVQGLATSTGIYTSKIHEESTQEHDFASEAGSTDETVSMSGENNTGTPVKVQLNSDGSYEISVSEGGHLTGQWQRKQHLTIKCFEETKGCNSTSTDSEDHAPQNDTYGISQTLEGTTSPDNPNVLSGSTTLTQNGGEIVTITWNLTRGAP